MWQCLRCDETVDDNFDICWNCGADRSGAVVANLEQDAQGTEEAVPLYLPKRISWPDVDDEGILLVRMWLAIWHLLQRLPEWCFAAALLALLWAILKFNEFEFFGFTSPAVKAAFGLCMFVPGALRRGKALQIVVMGGLGCAAPFLVDGFFDNLPVVNDYLLWNVRWTAGMMLLLACGEWLITPARSWSSLGWLAATCLSLGAAFAVVFFLLQHSQVASRWTFAASFAALSVLAWLAIPAGLYLATTPRRRVQWLSIAMACALLASSTFMFTRGFYTLAKDSFFERGLFSRNNGVRLLAYRGKPADYEFLLDRLREAAWHDTERTIEAMHENAWRGHAVTSLAEHDSAWAAEELSEMLRNNPSIELSKLAADLFAKEQRYEVAPVLMRYAMLSSMLLANFSDDEHRCRLALQEMRVPQVVTAWLYLARYICIVDESLDAQREGRELDWESVEFTVPASIREHLIDFYGQDAGPTPANWRALFEKHAGELPSPLTGAQRDETSRVIACIRLYEATLIKWWKTGVQVRAAGQANMEFEPAIPPDWNVPSMDALEAEVQRFAHEIDELSERVLRQIRSPHATAEVF